MGSVADACHGCGDFSGDLLIETHHLGGALADVAGEGFCLSLPGGPLQRVIYRRTVGDREVFPDVEPRRSGVVYREAHP